MTKPTMLFAALAATLVAGAAHAQYPILDAVANRVVQKYESSTCEELWQKKSEPKSAEEQRIMQFLREDPQMRTAFFNKVSGPIVNKMFECGMIP